MAVALAHILVVDDEENVSFVTVAALRLAGFEASSVQNGRAALETIQGGTPVDLVVLDVMLPDLTGFEVCRRLQISGADIPIVFLTARDAVDDRIRGLTIGGDDYLVKPFSIEELIARVRVILRRVGKLADGRLLRCDDVVLDDEAHTVTRAGAKIDLSPTEYKLLRYLLRNAGRVLTRAQILDHVWAYDFSGESTVVETFVSSLRKKIDRSDRRLIHTVRGVGYRISEY
ncbi:MAG: response regulator transcription factor [Nitrososphaerales archaeon]|jgi:two-component system OmpR family response regulator